MGNYGVSVEWSRCSTQLMGEWVFMFVMGRGITYTCLYRRQKMDKEDSNRTNNKMTNNKIRKRRAMITATTGG